MGPRWGEELAGGDFDWHFEAPLEAPLGTPLGTPFEAQGKQGKRGKQCKHFEAQCKQTRRKIALKYIACQLLSVHHSNEAVKR